MPMGPNEMKLISSNDMKEIDALSTLIDNQLFKLECTEGSCEVAIESKVFNKHLGERAETRMRHLTKLYIEAGWAKVEFSGNNNEFCVITFTEQR